MGFEELRLTAKFKKEWRNRVGGRPPSAGKVRRMIKESVYLQKGMSYRLLSGLIYYRPGLYWHTEERVVLKIDEEAMTVISVFSPKLAPGQREEPGTRRRERGARSQVIKQE